jgi:integrase
VNTQHRIKFEEAKALSRAVFARAADTPTNASAAQPTLPGDRLTLNGLRDRFLRARQIEGKDAGEVQTYVRRLTEFLGDLPIDEVTPEMLDRFKTSLRAFPVVKKPTVLAQSFNDILRAYEGDTQTPRLTTATIRRKWFGAFNRMFNYALELDLVARNPVTRVIPKKSEEAIAERRPFSADDIAAIFSAPLFSGHSGKTTGYRKVPGSVVTKDAVYWLPILSLWHGFRVEEAGAMRASEVRQETGVWVFDLTQRQLKTRESRRFVPVHPKVIQLGFLDYALSQTGEWLFPDLPHDPDGRRASTRAYTSWFGRWCDAHGFTDPTQSFHSFRHTFKRACREAGVPEELHDLLTGHKGPPSVGRGYGRGVALPVLAREIAKVDYPTFPLPGVRTS